MTACGIDGKVRCFGNGAHQALYARYHDEEWAIPCYDDQKLFESLSLEGAQAGLSWETVLKKREGYRQAFHHFALERVVAMTDEELEAQVNNPAIIRHRLKIMSVRRNARVMMEIRREFGSFSRYLWQWVDGKPITNHWQTHAEVPASTPLSDRLSKDLKKRGMTFVGSKILYAYLQAVGVVDDHIASCWKRETG